MEQMTPVLVVTPHPDDAEGGAGGSIAQWTKQGRKVVLVVCTNGDKGTSDRNVKPADLELVRQIRIHRPETVVTIDPHRRYLRHRDHAMCGRVTLDAIFPYARDLWSYPEHLQEGLEPHRVREVYLWGAEEPDTFLDITETFTLKMEALYCHASQMKRPRAEREARTRAYYAETGKNIGVELAEAFKRIEIGR